MLTDPSWTLAAGRFDPLTLAAAQWLSGLAAGHLLVIVEDVAGTLLPAQARAQLLAALRCVHAVVIAAPGEFSHPHPHTDYEADRHRTSLFIRRVIGKANHGA